MATVVTAEETLNAILERYPSGSAALGERLHYFAQHAHEVKGDSTTDAAVRKAYRLLSETCKRQGNVVLYKLVFGGNNKNSAPEDASMNMESGDASGGGNSNNADTAASSSMSISSPSPQQDPSLTVDTGVPYDATWVSDQERSHRSHRDALEHRLQVAQSQLHKESLRSAYLALAHHAGGDFTSRIHALLRAKDYCTHKAQTISVCLQIVAAALALHNTTTAVEYIHKLQHTLRTTPSSTSSGNAANNKASSSSQTVTQVDQILVNTAAALERMSHGDFGGALPYWLQVVQHEELETAFNSEQVAQLPYWVSVQDVSLYAALCCLTHGRADQRTALADHVTALEYVPHLQQCLTDFTHARYQAAWHCVAVTHTVRLQTDPTVGPYYDMWARVLCRKSLQHYWRAYTQVPLSVMAQDLGPSLVPSLDVLRQEWMDMILEQQQPHNSGGETKDNDSETLDLADTRLNLATDTLCRDAPTQRTQAATQLAKLTQQVLDDSYAMTIRLSCQEHDLCIANPMARKNDGADWRRPQAPLRRPGRGADYGGGGRVDPVLMNDDEEDDDYVAMQSDEDAAAPAAAAEDTTMVDASAMNPEDLY